VARQGYHGLYVEMKAGKNKPTESQREVMNNLENRGYKCAVCYSLDEFIGIINEYING
jgi:hypothetical protein